MELNSLLPGHNHALGIFTIKGGEGVSSPARQEQKHRGVLPLCSQASTFTLFPLAWYLIRQVDLTEHLEGCMLSLENSLPFRCLLAALLLLRGAALLHLPLDFAPTTLQNCSSGGAQVPQL